MGTEIDLSTLVQSAGASLAEAQGAMAGDGIDVPTVVAISDAELELRATLSASEGTFRLQPVSALEARRDALLPEAVSTVRVRFVAVGESPLPPRPPTRGREDVIAEVRTRPDVARLEAILTDLRYDAVFVPESARWLVSARDGEGRLAREVVLPDTTG